MVSPHQKRIREDTQQHQAVLRTTHDAFVRSVASADGSDEQRWAAAVETLGPELEGYATAQHRLATTQWLGVEVSYVPAAIVDLFYPSADGGVCGAGRSELRSFVAAHKATHAGAELPPDEFAAAVARINARWATTSCSAPRIVLDVGSCYNPYRDSELLRGRFDIIAMDLHPPSEVGDVFVCDWLRVQLLDDAPFPSRSGSAGRISVLPRHHAHVVVMSYFLSFLPTPQLRWDACRKAMQALVPENGALIIVEARRGGHRTTTASWPQRWTSALLALGLRRVRLDAMKRSIGLVFVNDHQRQEEDEPNTAPSPSSIAFDHEWRTTP